MTDISVKTVLMPCSDLKTVNAARVSMAKQHSEFMPDKDSGLIKYLATHSHWTPFVHNRDVIIFPFNSSVTLGHFKAMIASLKIEEHAGLNVQFLHNPSEGETVYAIVKNSLYGWCQLLNKFASGDIYAEQSISERILSIIQTKYPEACKWLVSDYTREHIKVYPKLVHNNRNLYDRMAVDFEFYMFDMTFYESVSIFVARQRFKAMVGFDYNEVSRRYVDDSPLFYTFKDGWRSRPDKSIKQGSGGISDNSAAANALYQSICDKALTHYEHMVDKDGLNIAPEMARAILPQGMMTEYYATGNFVAIDRLIKQRSEEHAQKEIRDFALAMSKEVSKVHSQLWDIISTKNNVLGQLEAIGVF